jgi:hypothetical protein
MGGKTMSKIAIIFGIIALGTALVLMLPVGGINLSAARGSGARGKPVDLSSFPAERPGQSLDLLFIHHSVGGHWLADPGPAEGAHCIFKSHPNGGGLRRALEGEGYTVHEASYGSRIGEDTDIPHWPAKFRDQMEQILACRYQDEALPEGRRNRIVMFKSCFPNNAFVGPGAQPGRADDPEQTVANAMAAYGELLGSLERHPGVLFVCVTAPPLAPKVRPDPLWKSVARTVLGKPVPAERLPHSTRLAREFNNWLKAEDGWLKGYPQRNVVVFDYYDLLTGKGESDLLRYPTKEGYDSHPSGEGQRIATEEFVPFLNRAVRRAGLVAE